jgi:hypothetical protein
MAAINSKAGHELMTGLRNRTKLPVHFLSTFCGIDQIIELFLCRDWQRWGIKG